MKFSHVAAATMLLGSFGLQAEVPELLELVPEAKGYELIAKFNPLRWRADGYQTDRSEQLSGAFAFSWVILSPSHHIKGHHYTASPKKVYALLNIRPTLLI